MKADRKAYQDQKQVQKLGNQRGDGNTGNAHSGGTQLSEDEQIVQPGVRRYRAQKLCDQNTGNRADCAGHHGENKSEVTAQSHGCNTGFAQLPNHDLIHDRKGGLQHSL
ncbi:hypothetical protein AAAT28_02585 [Faecalibacterium duncaniae]|uniref:hypothetical protein n=1 Tax=Faecalibacterium duncaniae (strain DSM 17677 / JCM 31915 / A2-165) TaxID=411483 RepID=UPI0032C1A9FB